MGKKAGNRKHSKIDALDPALRETVEQMLQDNTERRIRQLIANAKRKGVI